VSKGMVATDWHKRKHTLPPAACWVDARRHDYATATTAANTGTAVNPYRQALLTVLVMLNEHGKSRMDIALYIERVLAELERSDECMTKT
jgi:hypothetical protein